jgi:hypothetical protein
MRESMTRQQIIDLHYKMVDHNKSIYASNKNVVQTTGLTEPFVLKKRSGSTGSFPDLISVPVNDLQLNSKNPNKKLVGSFVVEATVMTNAHSVIEDEVGNVVKVQIPNPLQGLSIEKQLQGIKKVYPKGSKIAIKEPFLKIFLDGQQGIRVDDLNDIVLINADADQETPDIRSLANSFFKSGNFPKALALYTQELTSSSDDKKLLHFATNISIAHYKLKKYGLAFAFAFLATSRSNILEIVVLCFESRKSSKSKGAGFLLW